MGEDGGGQSERLEGAQCDFLEWLLDVDLRQLEDPPDASHIKPKWENTNSKRFSSTSYRSEAFHSFSCRVLTCKDRLQDGMKQRSAATA